MDPFAVPLDYDIIVDRIQKHKEGYDTVENKEIVFFMGETGAGKTTTILYLSGKEIKEEMVKFQVDDIELEEFKLCCNNPMPGFVIGHNPTSETIAVNSYHCSSSDLTFVDFAGQLDTNGHEVEIANTVGLYNTLSRVQSVRLVLVINYNTLSNARGQFFTKCLDYMNSFIPNLNEKFDSIVIFFTQGANLQRLKVDLAKLKACSQGELADFLDHLFKYVNKHGKTLLIDPTDTEIKEQVIEIIKASTPLETNSESFRFTLPNETRMLLVDRLNGVLAVIQHSLRAFAWNQIKKPLDDLYLLRSEISMMQEITEIYDTAKAMTVKAIQDLIAKVYTMLDLHDYKAVDTYLSLLAGASRLPLHIKLEIDIDGNYKDIREMINTSMTWNEREIEGAQSYVMIREKLELIKSISTHLQAHLYDSNKVLATKVEYLVQERVKKQFSDIMAQINCFGREGNIWMEDNDQFLLDLLRANLNIMVDVDKLFEGCTHYHSATDTLNKLLSNHSTKFITQLPQEPISPEIQHNFKVLKQFNQSLLVAHVSSDSRSLYNSAEKVFLQHLDKIISTIGMHAVNYEFVLISHMICHLRQLTNIDLEFCAQFMSEKFSQAINQIFALVTNIIKDVQEKTNDEITSCTVDGCKFIKAKVELLEQAKLLEQEFPDPTVITHFLSCIHDSFLAKAHQLQNVLDEALESSTFGYSQQGKELCTLLEIGIIPEAVRQFNAWINKYQAILRNFGLQVHKHLDASEYIDLASDFVHLENLLHFTSSYLLSVYNVFKSNANTIGGMMKAIIDKTTADWQQNQTEFLESLKMVGVQLSASSLEDLKSTLVKSVEKSKAINDMNMEKHLTFKPSAELSLMAKKLRSGLSQVENDTKTMISVGHLDLAEKNLPLVDFFCTALNCLDSVEGMPFSSLSAAIREKRLNMAQQIPEKLQRHSFGRIADILNEMKGASGAVEMREFENACMIVEDFFEDLVKSVRCTTIESVHEAIDTLHIFEKAVQEKLDSAVPNLYLIDRQDKISFKIKAYVEKNMRHFKQLLNDCKLLEVHTFVGIFSELISLHPDVKEFENINFQAEIEKHVKELPSIAASIIENGRWNSVSKIDKFIEQLENVQDKLQVNVDESIRAIEEQALKVVNEKDFKIKDLISQFKIEEASEELHALKLLENLKCLASFKAKGIAKQRSEDIECRRMSQFSWAALQHNPVQLSEDLATVKVISYSDYSEKLGSIEKLCSDLAETILSDLDRISESNSVYLRPLAGNITRYQNIANAFSKQHETFSKKLQDVIENRILPKLHNICNSLQISLQKAIKGRQIEHAGSLLEVMGGISVELGGFVSPQFIKIISDKSSEIHTLTTATAESVKFVSGLDLFEAINFKELVDNLSRLKENASNYIKLEYIPDLESYEDTINKILHNVNQKEREVKTLWAEAKFEPVVIFLENLQQSPEIVKHEALAIGFNNHFKHLTRIFYDSVLDLEKKAQNLYKEHKLEKVEEVQKDYAKIFKYFSTFREIFPSAKNNIIEILVESTSQQINDFCTQFASTLPSVEDVIPVLLKLKTFASTISNKDLAPHIHFEMNRLLNFLHAKNYDFFKLGAELCSSGALGRDIVEGDNFTQFKAVVITLMNKIIARMTPEDAMAQLAKRNKWTDTSHLQALFQRYSVHFDQLLQKYLMVSDKDMDSLITRTRALFSSEWNVVKESLPEFIAVIFAVWSVSASKAFYKDSKKMDTVLRPHPIQVLTIMCMLGLDSPDSTGILAFARNVYHKVAATPAADKIKGHLVQIGTGEGKSVILGVLSTILALLGCEVSCACYSSYLSERDYHAFLNVFSRFGVAKHIHYSTLAQLAGSYINNQGDIRQLTNQFIEGAKTFSSTTKSDDRPRVLLIDEVDTFLSRDFYGATYNPSTILKNSNVNFILEYIWKNQSCTLATVRELEGFRALVTQYKDISIVIEGAIQRMICEVKSVNDPPYHCVKNKLGQMVIGYQENGTISTSIQHGYKTCFAYLQARDKGKITNEIAQQHLGLTINCGQFSYAEIPKEYQCILGVTGTLETLCNFEKKVKDETYKIAKETYSPSIYGDSRLTFQKVEDVFVMSDVANYHLQLIDTITKRQKAMQPVLVFFESDIQLDTFATSSYCKGLTYNVIKESTENIDFYIRKSTRINETSGLPEVTFLPRVFGRGLDFACRDDRVNADRGIQVIQAFLSEDVSEEIQIKGRTARQGKAGSYCLILNLLDLVKQFAITAKQIEDSKNTSKLYEFLHTTRVAQFEKKSGDRKGIIERSEQVHHESLKFRALFKSSRSVVSADIVKFLRAQNPTMKPKSRIVCLSDATGSMSSVWDNAKAQISEMVKRITAIGGVGKSELMWVAYRDYSDSLKVECSAWSSEPSVLQKFIHKIVCTGGDDYPEAVELGLKEANNATGVTRVILIGDAPPHAELKGTKLASHNIVMPTDYMEQAALLASKGIPAYCFYMNEEASLVKSFKEIARATGGKAALFSNTNTLIDIVAENVLDDIGGDGMVLEYRKTYHS